MGEKPSKLHDCSDSAVGMADDATADVLIILALEPR